MVGNETPSYPITGEPVKAEALENTPPMVMKAFTNGEFAHHDEYNHDTTLEAIEQAQSRIDRLYMNATGIVDSLARNVMKDMACDVMTSLQRAHDAQNRDLMGLRASLTFAYAEYADTEDGWATAAADLAYAVHNTMMRIDAMLGIEEPR